MTSIRGPEGPIDKPEPKLKGGKKPKQAGTRYERVFVQKHGGRRVVGSGAFGYVDPSLKGDIRITIGDRDYLLESKSLNKINGRGEKIVNFPLSFLEKITKEAETTGDIPGLIYHPKGSAEEYLFVKFEWFKELVEDYVRQIKELDDRNELD
jgi:hypothetical protein